VLAHVALTMETILQGNGSAERCSKCCGGLPTMQVKGRVCVSQNPARSLRVVCLWLTALRETDLYSLATEACVTTRLRRAERCMESRCAHDFQSSRFGQYSCGEGSWYGSGNPCKTENTQDLPLFVSYRGCCHLTTINVSEVMILMDVYQPTVSPGSMPNRLQFSRYPSRAITTATLGPGWPALSFSRRYCMSAEFQTFSFFAV